MKISGLKRNIEKFSRQCAEAGITDESKEKLNQEIYDAKANIEQYMLNNEEYETEIGMT